VLALEEWFKVTESANSVAYYTLAIAYYQNDQQDRALEPASQAVALAKKPKQRWFQLLLALHLERKEYRESLPVLEQLVSLYPKKSYWLQLAAIYNELEMEKESLAAQQLAHVQGLLTEDKELERLAQLYLYYELPYRAALVMEKGLEDGSIEADEDSLELLANSLLTAKEYEAALEPLTRAAEFGETGKLYTRLGQAYIQREEWAQADSALRRGLEKGGIDDPCRSQLLLGITSYNQQKVEAARIWFGRAAQTEECGPAAMNWILHIERESPIESGEQGG
jgi:tetratricopeptide (TPR) repeat protein